MPPRRFSRYSFTSAISDSNAKRYLTEPEPFLFRAIQDTRVHIVQEGETLWTLAAKFYKGLPRPAGFWWVIADFQPDPIIDPTLELQRGRSLFIPSIRTVVEDVFADSRRAEATP